MNSQWQKNYLAVCAGYDHLVLARTAGVRCAMNGLVRRKKAGVRCSVCVYHPQNNFFLRKPLTPATCRLAVRIVYKPHSSVTVRALQYALTHLTSARTAGIRCAMNCLVRPSTPVDITRFIPTKRGKVISLPLFVGALNRS